MPFLTVGVEHRTAPLTVRERVSMDPETMIRASADLKDNPAIDEVVIVSTCNRTEIHMVASDVPAARAAATGLLVGRDVSIASHLRTWDEMEAAEHLFRVACGLESQVLGEPQVLGQVREAMDAAQANGTIGPHLHALFRAAISCARRARTETALGRIDASLGSEAVLSAERATGSLAGKSALLIGGGEIVRLVARELRRRQIGTLVIANRTSSVADELATQFGGRSAPFPDIPTVLPEIDLVFSATSAAGYVVRAEDLAAACPQGKRQLHIYDLAIPRDVEPAANDLEGVVLHDLDSLLPEGLEDHWTEDIRAMEGIVAAELHEFAAWYLTRRVVPVIAHLRSHVEAVSEQELKRVAPQLAGLSEREWAAVESLTGRLIDKMFHHLVMRLRFAAQTDPKLVEAAEFFFLHGEGGLFEHAAEQQRREDRHALLSERKGIDPPEEA